MNRVVEVLLTALALAGLFCAIPKAAPSNVTVRAQQTIVADGTDPMPICRRKRCF
jgi:hypothetical protein